MLKLCFDANLLVKGIHDTIKGRKPYYEYIDKVKLKSNYQAIFTSFTGVNILNRPMTFLESDPDKLMTFILKHTKEEMGLVDFLKGYLTYTFLSQDFSVTGLVGGVGKILRKNEIKKYEDVENYFNEHLKPKK